MSFHHIFYMVLFFLFQTLTLANFDNSKDCVKIYVDSIGIDDNFFVESKLVLDNYLSKKPAELIIVCSENSNICNYILPKIGNMLNFSTTVFDFFPCSENISKKVMTNTYRSQIPIRKWDAVIWATDRNKDGELFLECIGSLRELFKAKSFFIIINTPSDSERQNAFEPVQEQAWKKYYALNINILSRGGVGYKHSRNKSRLCVNSHKSSLSIYDPFFKKETIIQISDEFLQGKYSNVFPGEHLDLNGYPIWVSMFEYIPTAVESRTTGGQVSYSGYDGYNVDTLIARMNATPEYCHPRNSASLFGVVDEQGKLTGSAGDVAYKRADITGVTDYLDDQLSKFVGFLYPQFEDCVTFLVPKANLVPLYLNIFLPFSAATWTVYFCTLFCFVVFWKIILKSVELQTSIHFTNSVCLDILVMVLIGETTYRPTRLVPRCFVLICILFGIIMCSAFNSSLTSYLAVPKYYPDINTLEQLKNSHITIRIDPADKRWLISDTEDETSVGWSNHFVLEDDIGDRRFDMVAFDRNVGVLVDGLTGFYTTRRRGYMREGRPLIHRVKECVANAKLVFRIREDSPYLYRLDALNGRIAGAGLFRKWYDHTVFEAELEAGMSRPSLGLQPLMLKHVQTAFYILLLGLFLSVSLFAAEIVVHQ